MRWSKYASSASWTIFSYFYWFRWSSAIVARYGGILSLITIFKGGAFGLFVCVLGLLLKSTPVFKRLLFLFLCCSCLVLEMLFKQLLLVSQQQLSLLMMIPGIWCALALLVLNVYSRWTSAPSKPLLFCRP